MVLLTAVHATCGRSFGALRRWQHAHGCNSRTEHLFGVFIADDKFADVIKILQRRGWTRSSYANSPNFLLKWRNLNSINFRLLRKDQFVNHIFNSQQLSNKALLAQHLAFHQHHHSRRRRHGNDHTTHGTLANSSKGEAGAHRDFPGLQSDHCPVASMASGERRTIADGTGSSCGFDIVGSNEGPEAFFPRCWDMSTDGGVYSLLKAFAVSAAVAMLRSFVDGEDFIGNGTEQGSTEDEHGCSEDRSEGISVCISITSEYATSLQRTYREEVPRCVQEDRESPRQTAHCQQRTNHGGSDAADASVTVGNPEWIAVLKIWEKSVAGSQEQYGKRREAQGGNDTHTAARESIEAGIEQDTSTDASQSTNCSENTINSVVAPGGNLHSHLVARARETLHEVDSVDPQHALLGRANAWMVKPAGLSCGRGVTATSSLRGILSVCRELGWKAVVQKYVERPFLVQGFKFDIRHWVLVTSCNPLVLWGFDEGYVRFSSRPFTMDVSSLSDRFTHLCNHSVQKEEKDSTFPPTGKASTPHPPPRRGPAWGTATDGFDRNSPASSSSPSSPTGVQGHMWSIDQLKRYLNHCFKGTDVFGDVVLPRIRSVVVETLVSVREELEMKGRGMEWLGFDLMLTEDLHVMLIEVNVSPDVSHSTPITARLVPPATEDALRLLLDDGEAEARISASSSSTPHAPVAPRPHCPPPSPPPSSQITPPHEHEAVEQPPGLEGSDMGHATSKPGRKEFDGKGMCWGEAGKGERERRGDGREGCVGEQLRWRLWHKGEKESPASLGKLRESKKAWLRSRRQLQRCHVGDGDNRGSSGCAKTRSREDLFDDIDVLLGE